MRLLSQRKAALTALLFFSGLSLFTFAPRRGGAHEPVTTAVRFNKEVVRIFERSCLGCHAAGRIKADIPLGTYEEARPWAKAIKEEILEKRMPPYQAAKGFGHLRHDYTLAQRDVDLIVSWVEGGAPKGEDKDLPPRTDDVEAWPLGPPDSILQPASEARIAAEGDDDHHTFALATNLKEDRRLSAIDFKAGHGSVVHCASFDLERETGRRVEVERLGNWVPGQAAAAWPQGFARPLPAGARILLRVHYRKNGGAARDRSRVGLYFAEGPTQPVRGVVIKAPLTRVPAGAEKHRVRSSFLVTSPSQALAIRPRPFPFARSVTALAYRPDGTVEPLVRVTDLRHDWQPTYYFKRPAALPRGTRIEVTTEFNNSDSNPNNPHRPPRTISFDGELCEVYLAGR
jgi:hypothetical protein